MDWRKGFGVDQQHASVDFTNTTGLQARVEPTFLEPWTDGKPEAVMIALEVPSGQLHGSGEELLSHSVRVTLTQDQFFGLLAHVNGYAHDHPRRPRLDTA